jgi:hypothetical protein
MRAFLSRWRWQLLAVALCLAIAGSLGFLLLDQRRPHELRQAFSRVELGMSESAVRAVLGQDGLREIDKMRRGSPLRPGTGCFLGESGRPWASEPCDHGRPSPA